MDSNAQAMPQVTRPTNKGQNPRPTAYTMLDRVPRASELTSNARRGMRSHSRPTGPFNTRRVARLTPSSMPTMPSVTPAWAAMRGLGSTVYSVASPSSDTAVPRPSSVSTRRGDG